MDDEVTVANNVLHYYGEGGYAGGGFVESLLKTIARADQTNLIRLAQGFPMHVEAMRLVMLDAQGIQILKDRAQS